MLFFVVFSVLWNISSCAVIKTVEIAQLDDGTSWWENPFNTESNYMERFPSKPLDKDLTLERPSKLDSLSVKPFDQEYFTPKGLDRRRSKVKRYIWDDEESTTEDFFERLRKWTVPDFDRKKSTVKPTDYDFDRDYSSNIEDKVILWVYLPLCLVVVVGTILRECCPSCSSTTDLSDSSSSYQLHPPPRMTAPPPAANREEAPFNTAIPIHSQTLSTQSSGASNNVVDKPPDYSEVTLSDFGVGKNQFPEVKPAAPLDPPRYEAGNIEKY